MEDNNFLLKPMKTVCLTLSSGCKTESKNDAIVPHLRQLDEFQTLPHILELV
jgi:hypothetical protein